MSKNFSGHGNGTYGKKSLEFQFRVLVSEFQSLSKNYLGKILQGATELAAIQEEFFKGLFSG